MLIRIPGKKLYLFTFFLYHLREANIFKCTVRNHLLEIVVARAKITTDRKHKTYMLDKVYKSVN